MKPKSTVILIVSALVLAVAGFFVSRFIFQKRIEAKEFIGQVQKVEGSSVFLKGIFVTPDKPELARNGFNENVEIEIGPATQIVKIVMYMPTLKELEKTGGRWNPAELKREEKPGAIIDLTYKKEGLTIRVVSETNIFNKSKFIPQRIEYVEQVYPDRPQ